MGEVIRTLWLLLVVIVGLATVRLGSASRSPEPVTPARVSVDSASNALRSRVEYVPRTPSTDTGWKLGDPLPALPPRPRYDAQADFPTSRPSVAPMPRLMLPVAPMPREVKAVDAADDLE